MIRKDLTTVHAEVLTVSDSKSRKLREEGKDIDESGELIQDYLESIGIESERTIIPDDKKEIREMFDKFISDPEVDLILTTGGTGITDRDRTTDIAQEYFEKELPGFGEVLRWKSFEEIGGASILTQATAGVVDKKIIFCMPGSPNAVETAMNIIIPDLDKMMGYLR